MPFRRASCAVAIAAIAIAAAPSPRGSARAATSAQAAPAAPRLGAPTGYVTDRADVLSSEDRARLERYLTTVAQRLDIEIAVVTVPTTAPETMEDYSVHLFERWGIGPRKSDAGVLLIAAI